MAAHEFSRIPLLSELRGDRLAELAQKMRRERVLPGQTVVQQGDPGDRFYVVLEGMLAVAQDERGERRVLRPGDYFGEVALAMRIPRTASVRAMTPATLASCDAETFDAYVRPLFA